MTTMRAVGAGAAVLLAAAGMGAGGSTAAPPSAEQRLSAALLGDTPMASDLRHLTDVIGGRATGSPANREAVEWALGRLRAAGVEARKEPFVVPRLWLERSTRVAIGGGGSFPARAVAMPFSQDTPPGGLTGILLDGGTGGEEDIRRLGESALGAFVLVETPPLRDVEGLFREYEQAAAAERRAFAAGAAGVVYMSSRPRGLLYRLNASQGARNRHRMLVLEREAAGRALRLLREGRRLTLTVQIDLEAGGEYQADNVVADIPGVERPDEVVLLGAHLDSWDLGTGALDNGCNVAMLIDVARQLRALGLRPRRTIRIALWNGEEQGLFGSWGYVRAHAAELDRHVMAASFDIGSGRIRGFFTGGRGEEMAPVLSRALRPVSRFGPFTHVDAPIVGTDHFDFMLEGVASLVADQEDATYGPDYHASSDTFDKVDLPQLRRNAAVAAAVGWGFANGEVTWTRQSPEQVRRLVEGTSLKEQMRAFGVLEDWQAGRRGRR